jgi:GNAT superfamily N-acetyltransferase
MEIRRAEPADITGLAAVHIRAAEAAYSPLGADEYLAAMTLARRVEQWTVTLADPDPSAVYVAIREHAVVGFALVGPSRDADGEAGTGELQRLYVDPDAWGSGTGKLLMAAAVGHLTAHGFERATLWVLEKNDRARQFYEALGWKPDGVSEPAGRWIGFTNVRYTRAL